jgi:hypothetical protein
MCFRHTWDVNFNKHVGRTTYKPLYPNNEDLQVWKGVLNNTDLDDVPYSATFESVRKASSTRLHFDWLSSFPFRMRSWIPLNMK